MLATGEIAEQVWRCASLALGIGVQSRTWAHRVEAWMACAKRGTQKGILVGLLPSVITWKLWHRRCQARMEGVQSSAMEVWRAVRIWLGILANGLHAKKVSKVDAQVLKALDMNILEQGYVIHCKLLG